MIVKYLLKVALLGSSWVMYVLIALSVASIGAMVERWLFFRKYGRGGEALGEALCDLLENGDLEAAEGLLRRHPAIEAQVMLSALRFSRGGPDALSAAIDSEMTRRRKDLERGMTLLGTLGNNSPFIGLFGTVIGVIVAFADLAEGTSKVAMDKVMGGIAEALIATGVGLFVAIPAVVAYNIFQKRITDIEDNVSAISKRLCAVLGMMGSFERAPDLSAYAPPEAIPSEPPEAIRSEIADHDGHARRAEAARDPAASHAMRAAAVATAEPEAEE